MAGALEEFKGILPQDMKINTTSTTITHAAHF